MRLIYAEADGFPGLIVDSYDGHLVLQAHHPGIAWYKVIWWIFLRRLVQPKSITLRNDSDVCRWEGLPLEVEVISVPAGACGDPGRAVAISGGCQAWPKNGYVFRSAGKSSGNRSLAGGDVLDCFSYQGGFALQCGPVCRPGGRGGVVRPFPGLAQDNARLNQLDNIEWVQANCFDFLKAAVAGGEKYDLVILDPPAFAKSRADKQAAGKGYRDLNRRALQLLKPGGVLITCSCSYNLGADAFLEVLRQAGRESRRQARLIECRGAARDHPALLALPESSYLKCVLAMVV